MELLPLSLRAGVLTVLTPCLVAFIGASLAFPKIWDTISSRVGLQSAASDASDASDDGDATFRR